MRKRILDGGSATIPREISPPELWAKYHRLAVDWLTIGGFFQDHAALALFTLIQSQVVAYGKANRPNWVRASRKQFFDTLALSPRASTRALGHLLEARLIIRNKQDATLYRIPTSLLSIGAMNLTRIRDDLLPHPQEVISFQLGAKKTVVNDSVSSATK